MPGLTIDPQAASAACQQLADSVHASTAAVDTFRSSASTADAGASPVAQLVTAAARTGTQFADSVASADQGLQNNVTATQNHIETVSSADADNATAIAQT